MKVRRWFVAAAAVAGLVTAGVLASRGLGGHGGWFAAGARKPGDVFLVPPYVQLGDAPSALGAERLDLLWLGIDREARWSVEVRTGAGDSWAPANAPTVRRVAQEGVPAYRLGRATLSGLVPGEPFAYRVRRNGAVVFEARARARKPAGRPHRFVAFGDCGANTAGQRGVAYQTWLARPDFVMLTGDLVYTRGRVAEYLEKFFPIYNGDDASPGSGAPLMRSTLFLAAPGNHDLILRDLDAFPDGLAYFYYWAQPLNGPESAHARDLRGTEARRRAFLELAGPAYPRMASYSFDYGDAHWTVLDANTYADLTTPALRDWVARDLAAASGAAWRFVALHHPPFHSSKAHTEDQRTRVLADLFEKGKVDLVFCGHVHNYQRSFPLRFSAERDGGGRLIDPSGRVRGRWALDRSYDGRTRTTPDGIIYLVSGAGGARLYNTEQHGDSASWQEYTARFVSNVHSLTLVDVEPSRLVVRQVSETGAELDRFVVTRAGSRAEGILSRAIPTSPPEDRR